ncbi:MAG: hypothetical protein LUD74_03520 [Tannerellaceae bacterium]|nr:hypothetical protein [Tannerellaceae bacterium]
MKTKLWITTLLFSLIIAPVFSSNPECVDELLKEEVQQNEPEGKRLASVDYDLDIPTPRFYVNCSISNLQGIPWVNYHSWSNSHLDFSFSRADFLDYCTLSSGATSYYKLPVNYDTVSRKYDYIEISFSSEKAR